MKKKILFALLLAVVLTCIFAIGVSAETPEPETSSVYAVQFDVLLNGETEYTTVYTANTNNDAPFVSFDNGFFKNATYDESAKLFTFTELVDNSQIIEIDFSSATTLKSRATVVKSVNKATDPLTNCQKVKWFSESGSATKIPQQLFDGWTALSSFDFGCAEIIDVSTFSATGFETLVIPATVLQIKNSAFANCADLTTVTIEGSLPNGVGLGMFSSCPNLVTANLNELTKLGVRMFQNCSSLTTVSAIKATYIGEEAIGSTCTSMTTLTLNWSNITDIEKYAFKGLSCLPENLELSSVTTIGTSAFNGSTGFKTVNAPKLESLSDNAFQGCTSLQTISAPKLETVSKETFKGCSALQTINMPSVIVYGESSFAYCTALTSLTIPKTATELSLNSFYGCTSLSNVIFEENSQLTTIGKQAFYECSSLSIDLVIPSTVTSIGHKSFSKTGITSVYVPSTVTTIGTYPFAECKSLETAEVYTQTIVSYMFYNCTALESVDIPNATLIDDRAFSTCTNLPEIEIPATVQEIDACAFYKCTSLTSVVVPSGVTTIGDKAFEASGVTTAVVKSPVVGYRMFYGVPLTSITLENTVTIGEEAFRGCDFTEIVLPQTVESIAKNAFNYCEYMTEITIPDSVETLDTAAFSNCKNLTTINYTGENTSLISAATPSKATVVQKTECEAYYKGEHQWSGKKVANLVSYYDVVEVSDVCSRCSEEEVVQTIPQMFKSLGYSSYAKEGSISHSFRVDNDAIAEYEGITGKTVSYGLFVVIKSQLGENDIFDANGKSDDSVLHGTIQAHSYSFMTIKLVNFTDDTYDYTTEKFAFGAYVISDKEGKKEVAYLQEGEKAAGDKYVFVNYNYVVQNS